MMRKFSLLLLLTALVFVGCTTTNDLPNGDSNDTGSFSKSDFTLETEYMGDNNWTYTISADMPTPCHSFEVQVAIAESFPEQVYFDIAVTEPGIAETCIQQIDPQSETGEVMVDEEATFSISNVISSLRTETAGGLSDS